MEVNMSLFLLFLPSLLISYAENSLIEIRESGAFHKHKGTLFPIFLNRKQRLARERGAWFASFLNPNTMLGYHIT
jgi:hypothetical protein